MVGEIIIYIVVSTSVFAVDIYRKQDELREHMKELAPQFNPDQILKYLRCMGVLLFLFWVYFRASYFFFYIKSGVRFRVAMTRMKFNYWLGCWRMKRYFRDINQGKIPRSINLAKPIIDNKTIFSDYKRSIGK
jgi:hypothetical protein